LIETKLKGGGEYHGFPLLYKNKCFDYIVYMSSMETGMVIADGTNDYPVGQYRDDWGMSGFEPLKGQLVLVNRI
jgi:hypothetical protein